MPRDQNLAIEIVDTMINYIKIEREEENRGSFFLGDCKIEHIIFLNNNNRNNDNLKDDIQSKYGFKKLNKIEEKEICFFPNKNENNLNIIKNKNNDYENISIVSEMKKYYNEYIDIYNNDEQKKKFNSFIINIFNNNIIMTQKIETKRSKSK